MSFLFWDDHPWSLAFKNNTTVESLLTRTANIQPSWPYTWSIMYFYWIYWQKFNDGYYSCGLIMQLNIKTRPSFHRVIIQSLCQTMELFWLHSNLFCFLWRAKKRDSLLDICMHKWHWRNFITIRFRINN